MQCKFPFAKLWRNHRVEKIYFLICRMFAVILSFAVLIFCGFIYIFPHYYISELAISFLPYRIAVLFVGLFLSLIGLRKYLSARRWGSAFTRFQWFAGLFVVAFGLLFLLYSRQFSHFYDREVTETQWSGAMTFLFANIHKDNDDYAWIQQLIREENPDVLLFVEFSDHHYDALQSFLEKEYPYSNSTTRSQTFVGSMVFSKQKIENRADDFPQGTWRYGYFSLHIWGEDYYIYLVHTSSPDSYQHFVMRNEQLEVFERDFYLHETSREHDNVIVVGDFNVTPRSAYYNGLQDAFSGVLSNATRGIPWLLTWKFPRFPLLQAHIDHLRVSSGVVVQNLQSIDVPGSDHRGFLFEIIHDKS